MCLKPICSSSQRLQRANCGSGPPPPQQQQQQQPPPASNLLASTKNHCTSSFASGPSLAIGRGSYSLLPVSPLRRREGIAFSIRWIRSLLLLLCPYGGSVKMKSTAPE